MTSTGSGSVTGACLLEASALTLFFVIVFPGLAVVGLAALRLALLACAKNTKAVRPPGPHAPAPKPAPGPVAGEEGGSRLVMEETRQHPRGPPPRPGWGEVDATKIPERLGLGRLLPLEGECVERP